MVGGGGRGNEKYGSTRRNSWRRDGRLAKTDGDGFAFGRNSGTRLWVAGGLGNFVGGCVISGLQDRL